MYFSRIRLKPHFDIKTLARMIPANIYAEHQIVWKWFAEEGVKQRDFLFRREQSSHEPMFYTLSKREPVDLKNVWEIESRSFAPQLRTGQQLAFMLRANPVVTRHLSKKKHARDDVVMRAKVKYAESNESISQGALVQEAGSQWLTEQSKKHGFVLNTVKADSYFQHRLYKPNDKKQICFSTIDFEGVLEVTEPEVFTKMLSQGLGKSRSFGCGLMLVKRV